MENVCCTLCQSENIESFRAIKQYYKCKNCEGVFLYPLQNQDYYLSALNYLSDPETYISLIDPKGFRFLLGHFEKHFKEKTGRERGSVLEIGSGVGYAMFMLFSRDWDVAGIETSGASAEWGRKYLRMPIKHSTIDQYSDQNKYDAILMIEVLEHFLSVKNAMRSIKKFIKNKGVVFGTTPNVNSENWKKHPEVFAPSDHIFLFSEKSLNVLCELIGATDLSIDYFGSKEHPDSNFIFSFRFSDSQSSILSFFR